jgi:malonate-semialdehyde dehydrogenase (acetylating)/methylmalonate-semialdehyde dehydrogenase
MDSAFGNAGQRCLAASLAVTVGEADEIIVPALAEAAQTRVVGYGLDEGAQMGPVITPQSKARIEDLIQKGLDEGAELVVDGRNTIISGYEHGYFVRPTILSDVSAAGRFPLPRSLARCWASCA